MTLARRPFPIFALLFMLGATSTRAFAQTPPPATPPVARDSTDVPYPEGAHGDAVVVLELLVDKDGTVSSAVVIEGVDPFADHARRAVLAWRFVPARRADTPVTARIRARIAFRQPALGPSATQDAATTAPSARQPQPVPEPEPDAVTVHGPRREIGQTTLSAADVRAMPGAFGDAFRAIESLPSVTPVISGLPYFFIRGAPPNDNGYFIDGIRVPLLFHVGVGQSVIHPGLIDRVDFFPGAPPASYGGFAGAIIAGQLREPGKKPHGEANLRIVDAGALVEAPLGDRANALVAGRYGYPGAVLGLITNDIKLGYGDYQLRANWRVTGRDTIGIFAFGSHDYFATVDSRSNLVEQMVSDFHRIDLRYDRAMGDGRMRVAATLGYDRQGAAPSYVTDLSTGVRLEVDQKLSRSLRVRGGADARVDHYGFEQGAPLASPGGGPNAPPIPPVPSSADPPPTNVTWGAHADLVWRIAPRVELVPGVRVDVFESTRANGPGGAQTSTLVPAFDPRLAARITLAKRVAWLSTFGLSHQYPALRVGSIPAPVVAVPGFPLGGSTLQTVAQASQGVELALPGDLFVTTTAFLSRSSGLTDLTANCLQISGPLEPQTGTPTPYTCPSGDPVHGRAYGLELLVRRPISKRVSGSLSYTLSRSTREAHFLTLAGGDAVATVLNDYDRTHAFNAIVSYDLGLQWRAGARFLFYSGAPYSALAGNVAVPPYNDRRGPFFFRLDVRLEKRWLLGHERSIAFVAEVQNATLSTEVTPYGLECRGEPTPAGQTTVCTQATVGPLTIPSVGVEGFF